jgi:hypothetical protein
VRTPYGREGVSEDMVKEISLTGTMDQEKGEGGEERREIHSVVRGDPLYISNIWRSLDTLSPIRILHTADWAGGGIGVPCQAFHNPSN